MKRLLLILGACIATVLAAPDAAQAQSGDCPPCYKDRNPMSSNTRANQLPRDPNCYCATDACPGCSNDLRLVVRIRFDTQEGYSWINGRDASGGYIIEPAIYDAVKCAAGAWNTARGSNGATTHYFFIIDQEATNAQIIIRKEQPYNAPSASISGTPAPPYTMKLTPSMKESDWPDSERCGSVKHELGHPLNAGNANGYCDSIMEGVNATGSRYTNTIYARDVDAASRNTFDQATCTGSYVGENAEPADGGGDPCGGDPCCGDPCCGDYCCYDPSSCGGYSYCITYTGQDCHQECWAINAYTGRCDYWHYTCEPYTWVECY
ncbi:MAG: hypothetical protein ACJ754_21390 [Pyrinomonadaceae bacterium]